MESNSNHIQFGSIRVFPTSLVVEHRRNSRKLTPRDMDVLVHLIEAEGDVVSRESILENVWRDTVVNDEAVSLSVSRIRTALGESAKKPRIIQTIPKRGYRVVPPGKGFRVSKGRIAFALVSLLLIVMTMLFLQVQSIYHEVSSAGL